MMRTWVRSLTKLRLHHINDPSPPSRIVYFPGNTSELSLQPKFPSSRVHVALDLRIFSLCGIFWPQTSK